MADILDKVITLGIGLEKKATKTLDELEKLGTEEIDKEESKEKKKSAGLGAKKEFENRLVDSGVKAIGEFIALLTDFKEKAGGEVCGSGEKLMDKLRMASQDELQVVKEMARIAREKVDALEKRVAVLEGKKPSAKKKAAPRTAKTK